MRTKLQDGEKVIIEKHNKGSFWSGKTVTCIFHYDDGSSGHAGGSLYITNQRIIFENPKDKMSDEQYEAYFGSIMSHGAIHIISFDNISLTTWRKDSFSVLEINGSETKFSLKEDIQEIQEQIEMIFFNVMRQK